MRTEVEAPEPQLIVQMSPVLLRPSEAARVLAISERLLWELTVADEIRAANVGTGKERKALRYLPEDLLAWARQRRDAGRDSRPEVGAEV